MSVVYPADAMAAMGTKLARDSRRLARLVLLGLLGVAASLASPAAAAEPTKPAAPLPRGPAPSDLIAKGQTLFDELQYEESIQALSAALLRPNNTKAQKIDIHRLLALNYITLGRKDEAESAVRGLLVIDPAYRLNASESPRFRDFFTEARAKWDAEGRPGLVKDAPTPQPIQLRHASPSQAEPNQAIELRGNIDDPDGRVARVALYYRTGSRGDFSETTALGKSFRAQIPGAAVRPPLVEYYLVLFDAGGEALATRGEASAPLRIAIPEASKGWVLPVALGGSILGAAAIVGTLALAGVFRGSDASRSTSVVSVTVSE